MVLLFAFLLPSSAARKGDAFRQLETLDSIISNKGVYTAEKMRRIDDLKRMLSLTTGDRQRYELYSKIFDEYRAFSMDSSYLYARRKQALARKMDDPESIYDSDMNLAEVYGTAGMYKEALDLLSRVPVRNLTKDYLPYYYHLYRTIYGLMGDYSISQDDKQKYLRLRDVYRDSLLLVNEKGTYLYTLIESDGLNCQGRSAEAKDMLNECLLENSNSEDAVRTLAYTLATAYKNTGDVENEKYYLALSAISDLKQASKEYSALLDLSMLLYDEGDLKRAYDYLKCSMEDAAYCNARLRTIEISKIFPIVDNAYQRELDRKKRQRSVAMMVVSLLSLALLASLIVLSLQNKKLAHARKALQSYSKKLKETNDSLRETNLSLKEANLIKTEIIEHYLDLSSIYLDKMNKYRSSLVKIGTYENSAALFNALRSTSFIENELKEFYDNFDDTFLKLFPTFVNDFNSLLSEEGRIYPKSEGRLNTELRVFALIRLGVSDSAKIAQFLRCSVTTIYNYRVKARNSALGDRSGLEEEVMGIGKEAE